MLGTRSLLRFACRTALRATEYGLSRTGLLPAAQHLARTLGSQLQRWGGQVCLSCCHIWLLARLPVHLASSSIPSHSLQVTQLPSLELTHSLACRSLWL